MNLCRYYWLHLLLLLGYCFETVLVLGFGVPSTVSENDAETNRVLEEFIWQKIIRAPTDPKKAYQELQSSLEAISAESNIGEQIKLPKSLITIGKTLLTPRSLRRRSSYPAPLPSTDSGSIPGTSVLENTPQKLIHNPSTTNKYIPEYGTKDLYALVASVAGNPDKEQPPLPSPPPPPPLPPSTPEETTSNDTPTLSTSQSQSVFQRHRNHHSNQQEQQQEILKELNEVMRKTTGLGNSNNRKLSSPIATKQIATYSGPINARNYFTMHKVTKHMKQQKQASSPTLGSLASSSNQLNHQMKPELNNQNEQTNQQMASAETTLPQSGTHKHRGHQQTHSQSIYDILPMPTYGSVKSTQPFQSFGDSHLDVGDHPIHSSGESGEYIPSSPALLAQQFEAKRTFEIVPLIEQKVLDQQTQEPIPEQHYVPVQPPPPIEPQIIDVVPDEQPIQIVFRSSSAKVNVKQVHTPVMHNEVETTRTEEKPQRVLHQLVRPIVQEVVEIIQPYRRVTQEIRPVLEEIRTVVAKQSDHIPQRVQNDRLGSPNGKW